jgi:hypothetical protein
MALERGTVSVAELADTHIIVGPKNSPLGNRFSYTPTVDIGDQPDITYPPRLVRRIRKAVREKYRAIKSVLKDMGITRDEIQETNGLCGFPGDIRLNISENGIVIDRLHSDEECGVWHEDRLVVTRHGGRGMFQRKTYLKEPHDKGDIPISVNYGEVGPKGYIYNPAFFLIGLTLTEQDLKYGLDLYRQ